MRGKALAGTKAAHVRCLTCGHERIRHLQHGTGRCTDVHYLPVTVGTLDTWETVPCRCAGFDQLPLGG